MSRFFRVRKLRRSLSGMLALTFLFLIAFSGCANTFSKDYIVIKDHEDVYKVLEPDSSVQVVSNYAGMKNAVLNLVSNASEYGVIRTKNYSGDVTEDISRACHEVTRETPLGVYAVEYMSHTPRQMISYYEIELSISYKKSSEEINNVVKVKSGPELFSHIDAAIKNSSESIALLQVSFSIEKDMIQKHVDSFYRNNPDLVYELPKMTIVEYPNTKAIQKIIEINFDYSRSDTEIAKRVNELNKVAANMASGLEEMDGAHASLKLTERLIAATIYYRGKNVTDKTRAYDALVNSEASSEGYAMAFKLQCSAAGIDCTVIEGRMNSERHYWNIIKLGMDYYHIDTFMCDIDGIETAFLKRDSDMWGKYWWDTEEYEKCNGALTYSSLIEADMPEEEPEQELTTNDRTEKQEDSI